MAESFIRVRPCVFTDVATGRRYLVGADEHRVSCSSPNGRAPFDVVETIEPRIYWLDELEQRTNATSNVQSPPDRSDRRT